VTIRNHAVFLDITGAHLLMMHGRVDALGPRAVAVPSEQPLGNGAYRSQPAVTKRVPPNVRRRKGRAA
jgi:hypothetical protein